MVQMHGRVIPIFKCKACGKFPTFHTRFLTPEEIKIKYGDSIFTEPVVTRRIICEPCDKKGVKHANTGTMDEMLSSNFKYLLRDWNHHQL